MTTAARGQMRYRATLERNQRIANPGGGHTDNWTTIATDLPCWAWLRAGSSAFSQIRQEGAKATVVDARHVTVPIGTDAQVGDRITVRNRRQTRVIFDGLIIDGVGERVDHMHLISRKIT